MLLATLTSVVNCYFEDCMLNSNRRSGREHHGLSKIRYVDLLCQGEHVRQGCVTTIFGFIPAIDCDIPTIEHHDEIYDEDKEEDEDEAKRTLEKAMYRLQRESEVDVLALQHILYLFYKQLRNVIEESTNSIPINNFNYDMVLERTECLEMDDPCAIINRFLNNRMDRIVFSKWLRSYLNHLEILCSNIQERRHCTRLRSLYALYMKTALRHLLCLFEAPKVYGGAAQGYEQRFFIMIPSNYVSVPAGVETNEIMVADNFVDKSKVEK